MNAKSCARCSIEFEPNNPPVECPECDRPILCASCAEDHACPDCEAAERRTDRHSVNCFFCGNQADERDCTPADDLNDGDGGSCCPQCRQAADARIQEAASMGRDEAELPELPKDFDLRPARV